MFSKYIIIARKEESVIPDIIELDTHEMAMACYLEYATDEYDVIMYRSVRQSYATL